MKTHFCCRTVLIALAIAAAGGALGQEPFPAKPIRLVVGAPPGGAPDTVARIVAQRMNLGQPIVVENRTGAASMIAAAAVAKANADGYTLLIASQTTIAVSPIINKVKTFDPQKDFAGVALIGSAPLVLVAGPALTANSVPEIIALAKSAAGDLDYGNGGVGTSPYMAGALFSVMTGAKLRSIPYPGEQAAMIEIMAGRLPMMFANAAAAMPHVKTGRLRAIAVTSSAKADVAPGLPTVAESGVPGFEIGTWLGILAPSATPVPVIEKIGAEVRRVLALPEVKERLHAQGFLLASDDSPEQFNRFIKTEYAKWSKLIQDADIKAE